jgi:hypothetical protein
MKITVSQLRRLIKEEVSKKMNEAAGDVPTLAQVLQDAGLPAERGFGPFMQVPVTDLSAHMGMLSMKRDRGGKFVDMSDEVEDAIWTALDTIHQTSKAKAKKKSALLDVSGPAVEMMGPGGDSFTLGEDFGGTAESAAAHMNAAAEWCYGLPRGTRIRTSAASGISFTAVTGSEEDEAYDEYNITFSTSPLKMSHQFRGAAGFFNANSKAERIVVEID